MLSPARPQELPAVHRHVQTATSADFDKLVGQAAAARDANHFEEAIGLYTRALKLKPKWAEGWWYLGTLHYDADRYSDALPDFRNLVQLAPENGPAWALLGLCEFETHDYDNALVHLQRARSLGLGKNDELVNVTRYHQALVLITKGEFEAAMELLSSLVNRGVTADNVKVAMGLTLLRVPLLPVQVDPSKDALIHQAGEIGELSALSDFDQADAAFQKMLKRYPNTPFLHYAYGTMLTALTRFDEAEQQLKEETRITADSALPHLELGYLYLKVHRYSDARDAARQAMKLAPQAFPSHYLLGRALLELGDVSEAVRALETARRLGPFSPEVHYTLARAYARARRSDEARREEAEFQRLNGLMARRDKLGEGQSYRLSSDRANLQPQSVEQPETAPPQAQHPPAPRPPQ